MNGNDVTTTAAVTVKLNVTELDSQNPKFAVDVPEDSTTPGDSGVIMVLSGGQFQYNVKTTGFESGTVNNGRFFLSDVTVYYNSAPTVLVGEEDATLESK